MALGDLEGTHRLCSTSHTHGADLQRKFCFDFQQQGLAGKAVSTPLPLVFSSRGRRKTEERNGKRRWGHQSTVFLPHGGHPQTPLPRAHQQQEKSPRLLQHTLC